MSEKRKRRFGNAVSPKDKAASHAALQKTATELIKKGKSEQKSEAINLEAVSKKISKAKGAAPKEDKSGSK